MKDVFDNELADTFRDLDNSDNCLECGSPIGEDETYCSSKCYYESFY